MPPCRPGGGSLEAPLDDLLELAHWRLRLRVAKGKGLTSDRLDRRTLNRTTLHRQLLLARSRASPLAAVSHLMGMQAQIPGNPYVGMWSRLADFDPESLSTLLPARSVLRMVAMRGTIHLLTADDAVQLRAYAQPALEQELRSHGEHKEHLREIDLDPVIDYARPLLTASPLSSAQLRALLEAQFPDLHSAALALACRNRLPLVQTPPRGLWQRSGGLRLMTLQGWIGRDSMPVTAGGLRETVLRYLAAFGPALAGDIVAWSRMPELGRTMEQMAAQLRTYVNDTSQRLFDLEDAEIISADVPSPPRFLPEYDNVLLSHRDRSRFDEDERRARLGGARTVRGTVLIDGLVGAAWRVSRDSGHRPATQSPANLQIELLDKPTADVRSAIEAEGLGLLQLLAPVADRHEVSFSIIE